MASRSEQRENLTLGLGKRRSSEIDEEEEEEREIVELERQVKELGEKILESQRTTPERILEVLSSHLEAQRPAIPQIGLISSSSSLTNRDGEAGTSSDVQENTCSSKGISLMEADTGILNKLRTFKDKTARNIATMPVILKRMNECIARLDRLDQYNINLHSAFKRKRK